MSVAHQMSGSISTCSVRSRRFRSKATCPTRRQDEALLRGRGGADDESPRSDFTSAGQADHVVAGSRDSGDFEPQHAALAVTVPEARLRRAVGPASGETESEAGAG